MKVIAAEVTTFNLSDFFELTKPRITTLVLTTTVVGFCLASRDAFNFLLLFHTILGTGLVASGASALNMVMEWSSDSRMKRTESRPIPSGRLTVMQSVFFGTMISFFGVFYLLAFVNLLAGLLAALTAGLYLFAYTPLKKRTHLCTLVGAIPGAIPPLIGWAAAQNSLEFHSYWLFTILFLWQLPHFLAIAWLYREDYARGGFPMLPVIDTDGRVTSRQIVLETLALWMVSMIPAFPHELGLLYFTGAFFAGLLFLTAGIRLAKSKSLADARRLLLTSVFYLPLLLLLMMVDKLI